MALMPWDALNVKYFLLAMVLVLTSCATIGTDAPMPRDTPAPAPRGQNDQCAEDPTQPACSNVDNQRWYIDNASQRPFYREGYGPFYHEVQHSFYSNPTEWFESQ